MADELPPDILVIIDYLAEEASHYKRINARPGDPGRLHWQEEHEFKSDLMKRGERWARDRVPLQLFRDACLAANLDETDTKKLADHLAKRQAGKRLVVDRARKGFTFDRILELHGQDPDADLDMGKPSEDF
ncbi:hypothetical protein ACXDF8_02720 [Mycolicibacterium sp. CBM1]